MKLKILLAALAAMGLVACSDRIGGAIDFGRFAVISGGVRVSADTSKSGAEITISKEGNLSVGKEGNAEFSFRSTPGAPASRILGYRVITDKVDGIDFGTNGTDPVDINGLNMYVQSGYVCTPAPAANQSCNPRGASTELGDGTESGKVVINFQTGLQGTVIAARAAKTRVTEIAFIAETAGGSAFLMPNTDKGEKPITVSTTVNYVVQR